MIVRDIKAGFEPDPLARASIGLDVFRDVILHIFITDPGTLPLDREAGIGLISRWMDNSTEDNARAIAADAQRLIGAEDWARTAEVRWNESFDNPIWDVRVVTAQGAINMGITAVGAIAARSAA